MNGIGPRALLRRRRAGVVALISIPAMTLLLALAGAGVRFYTFARFDPLQNVDAIVVLGGAHDGRERYGIDLARRGYASEVVLSDPYRSSDATMRELCSTQVPGVRVTCFVPDPRTTRGEADGVRELVTRNGWHRIMVLSWRYHLPRARFIFERCVDVEVVTRPVPLDYDYGLFRWAHQYLYQTGGFVKAASVDRC
ncbi:YdcF family protein [Rhodococcus gannanensis]|uniref:YdcF family protein n=2 Tax=Rhodococcus gannanensis TaxID=1960308 RepID=A0ABW4NY24_9NOCA